MTCHADRVDDIPWNEIGLQLSADQIEPFRRKLGRDETISRLKALSAWIDKANLSRDLIELTPRLLEHLSEEGDFGLILGKLDRLRAATRKGEFAGTEAQKELEFGRFVREYRTSFQRDTSVADLPPLFDQLDQVATLESPGFPPLEDHAEDVERAAGEAMGLLKFLRFFRTTTSRPVVVIGNDKAQVAGGGYGRQWVVAPLEEYLKEDFGLTYNRVPSHASVRLVVPPAFAQEFVQRIGAEMPHLIIVDGASASRQPEVVRFSKAVRGYANWFAVFNDLRARGEESRYFADAVLPVDHLRELKGWHDYVTVKEQIEPWVGPGPTYKIRAWASRRTESMLLGEVPARWPSGAVGGDEPQVVFANPIVYGDAPPQFGESQPYALDSADRWLRAHLEESAKNQGVEITAWAGVDDNPVGPAGGFNPALTVFGFGSYGFERRVFGPTFERYVAELQRRIKTRIRALLAE